MRHTQILVVGEGQAPCRWWAHSIEIHFTQTNVILDLYYRSPYANLYWLDLKSTPATESTPFGIDVGEVCDSC